MTGRKDRPHLFVLDGHEVRGVWDVLEWGERFELMERTVMRTKLIDGSIISTVFLGVDHGWNDPPVLFETALISGELTSYEVFGKTREAREVDVVARYSTWAEAEAGHMAWIEACVPPDLIELTTKENTP